MTVVTEDSNPELLGQLHGEGILVGKKAKASALYNLVLLDSAEQLLGLESYVKDDGFALLKCDRTGDDNPLVPEANFLLVAQRNTEETKFLMFKKRAVEPLPPPVMINVDAPDFSWLPLIQAQLLQSSANKDHPRIYVTSFGQPTSGIVGFVKCLRQEVGGHKVRCIFSARPNLPDALLARILEQDLRMNVVGADGDLGSYRHLSLAQEGLGTLSTPYAFVNYGNRGNLSSLRFVQAPAPTAESRIWVHYAPLNFRDVMLASGKLALEALPGKLGTQDCVLGLEFAGKGKGGRRVMGIVESRGLATFVTESAASFLWDVPEGWSLEDGSTVPVVYATAYYALIMRGRMKARESVLIHTGSGGVGIAAISIALSMNCTVFTTVGSDEKRAFLKSLFPQLTDYSFANSRDTTFEEHIKAQTDDRGVDLVLNSLAEEKLQASVRCLANGGRFLEIGKYDLSKNNALGLEVFLKNVTFHGILLDALFEGTAEDKAELWDLVARGIGSGAVRPLPRSVFGSNQIEEAFRFMANGKHVGKVLLKLREESQSPEAPLSVTADARVHFEPEQVYIVIGGLGGVGFELGAWLVEKGARKVVLVGRSGIKNQYQAFCIRRWNRLGAHVLVLQNDVTTRAGARELLKEASVLGPVGGIFNLAMVLVNATIDNQTPETFEMVAKSKVDATMALDSASRELCPALPYFVVFSSVACGQGIVGQTNYGLANSVAERICEERRKDGYAGHAIQWGAIGDVGVVYETLGGNDTKVSGTATQPISSVLSVLEMFLTRPDLTIVSAHISDGETGHSGKADRPSLLASVAKVLGLKNPASIAKKSLTCGELGVDSLMAIEIKQILEWYCDLSISVEEVRRLSWERIEELSGHEKEGTSSG